MTLTNRQQLAAMAGLLFVLLLWAVHVHLWHWPVLHINMLDGVDNYAYWSAWQGGGLYESGARLAQATYLYSPAFAQVLYPFTLLSWDLFRVLWVAAAWAAMAYLLWPLPGVLRWAALVVACFFCLIANADWIVALCLGLGLRYPATWAGLLLTKVTPGIGVVWFAVRREWRNLGIAMGATLAIVTVSAVVTPTLWIDWISALQRSVAHSAHGDFFGLAVPPLEWRLPVALGLVILGGLRGWRWVLPTAALIAQPDIWGWTVVYFAALPRLYQLPLASARSVTDPEVPTDALSAESYGAASGTPAGAP